MSLADITVEDLEYVRAQKACDDINKLQAKIDGLVRDLNTLYIRRGVSHRAEFKTYPLRQEK